MSTISNNKIATLLLHSLPVHDQVRTVRHAARNLDATSDESEIGLVAALLQQCQDAEAHTELINRLESFILAERLGLVISIYHRFPDVGAPLLSLLIENSSLLPAQIRPRGSDGPAVSDSNNGEATSAEDGTGDKVGSRVVTVARTTAYLQFLAQAPLDHLRTDEVTTLFNTCCVIVRAADQKLCLYARDCILGLFKVHPGTCSDHVVPMWDSLDALIRSKVGFPQRLGYTIWLRWIASEVSVGQKILEDPAYWERLRNGLQFGDSERRKISLQILKASIELAVDELGLSNVVSEDDAGSSRPDSIKQQYGRYCTVFETIVLGRYLNQIQECEADLDFLASSQSVVKAAWLFTLLTSALDQNVHESNRKFIANWILRSTPRASNWEAYVNVVQKSLLPWAAQGYLFTSSLRYIDGYSRCLHGEDLADYISRLLESAGSSEMASNIIDIILRVTQTRQGRNFAYTRVYLLEGLGRAIARRPKLTFIADQIERLNESSAMTSLPEVARDYIHAKCLKLCFDLSKMGAGEDTNSILSPDSKWNGIRNKALHLKHTANVQKNGSISSWNSQPSKREIREKNIIRDCSDLVSEMQGDARPLTCTANAISSRLDDIWSDLEYLEYPKDVLMVLPETIVNPSVISLTTRSNQGNTELAENVSRFIGSLAGLSRTRPYLLSPLVTSIRRIRIQHPDQSLPIDLDGFIIELVCHPPKASVDVKLEDATATLMKDLGPDFQIFNYEYYFGPRESYGIASLLDLIGHLQKADAAERVMRRLLSPWINQSIPPPSVSPWKNTLQLQAILICIEISVPTIEIDQARNLLKDLHHVLAIEALPRYRYLLEWMITRIHIHHPLLRLMILEELRTKDHHSNPKFLASLMKIGIRTATCEGSDEEFASNLANIFVPLAASSKIVIRHEAQWQIPLLLDYGRKSSWTKITENRAIQELDEFIRSLSRFDDPPLERTIDVFDPIRDHNLTHLVEGPWFGLDDIEQPLCHREDFVKLFASDAAQFGSTLPPPCMPLGPPIPSAPVRLLPTDQDHTRRILQNVDNISRALGAGPGPAALQTKGDAYLDLARARHSQLLVVSSLVDNPHNLGGLSRVAEIFGAGAMYVQSAAVTGSKDFTNVSVSSHLHLPIRALAVAELPEFLARKRMEEGFSVVGIEQTDRSVKLGSPECGLPEKCVLVLGSEREGIPALVLSECDVLVEIPQMGVTRSLNVQTAAGIVLCEYTRQHRKKK